MDLQDKVVVITGGVSGLGRACAELFVREGARVVLFDLNDSLGQQLGSGLGDNLVFVRVDVTSEESVKAGLAEVRTRFGDLHVCINCAGIGPAGKTLGRHGPLELEKYQRVISINLIGTFNVMRLAAEVMSRQEPVTDDGERGVIINTASVAAFEGQIGQVAYSASRGGIVAMTLPAARDLAPFGIRVNAIAPGIIDTPMLGTLPDATRKMLSATVQFPKRPGRPEDFARLTRDIVCNSYINGEVIRLDGGLRMGPS